MQLLQVNRRSGLLIALLAFLLITSVGLLITPPKADALSGSQFNAGRIIDDLVFYNKQSMSAAQIQQFLNAKVPVCDTNGSQRHSSGQTRAQYGASQGYPAPYTCLKNYQQAIPSLVHSGSDLCQGTIAAGTKSAAQIIYDVAQSCRINPQVLMVLLQKEQSLISDDWPWSVQYRSATGYGCPDTAPCDSEYYGFFNQVYQAAKAYKRYQANPTNYNYSAGRNNTIRYNPNAGCGSSTVYIGNQATAGLYIYTPYQPNAAALNNLYGNGDSCSAYGNRNFWRMFNDWFGNTYAAARGGIDYSAVFNAEYYLAAYPDLRAAFGDNGMAAFDHFVSYGIHEGRRASAEFNFIVYKNRNPDLRVEFGGAAMYYYHHYISHGKAEGRVAVGDSTLIPLATLYGINYSSVYNFDSYLTYNSDMRSVFGGDDIKTLQHFVSYGMKEGRMAIDSFSAASYRNRYVDLRRNFGNNNLEPYYLHYISNGRAEGRIATGSYFGGTTVLDGVDYSPVYEFNTYLNLSADVRNTFGIDDTQVLRHYVNYGMAEGRIGSPQFNVHAYKQRYNDLWLVFGGDLKSYYLHYLYHGRKEGRIGI